MSLQQQLQQQQNLDNHHPERPGVSLNDLRQQVTVALNQQQQQQQQQQQLLQQQLERGIKRKSEELIGNPNSNA